MKGLKGARFEEECNFFSAKFRAMRPLLIFFQTTLDIGGCFMVIFVSSSSVQVGPPTSATLDCHKKL